MRTAKTTLREYTAGELRARLARERISVTALARRLGWSQSYLARRVDGRVAFDLDDLEKVADELGIHVADLLPTPSTANTLP
ncbi:helix-turn-helix domain-containing protein [Micromonospora fluostatini]